MLFQLLTAACVRRKKYMQSRRSLLLSRSVSVYLFVFHSVQLTIDNVDTDCLNLDIFHLNSSVLFTLYKYSGLRGIFLLDYLIYYGRL